MALDNDTRGWIMTLASGIACVLGASIICVDVLIRQLPGHKGFKIQDSNAFLSSSLSLSFGVMFFSALYSMLPSAKGSLTKGGFSPKAAAWILIACFIIGIGGIQLVSRVLHHYIPSHVVDCDHTHDEESDQMPMSEGNRALPSKTHPVQRCERGDTSRNDGDCHCDSEMAMQESDSASSRKGENTDKHPNASSRRMSLPVQWGNKVSELMSKKYEKCETHGQCFGFSEPCGFECFKNISARGGTRLPSYNSTTTSNASLRHPGLVRSATSTRVLPRYEGTERQPLLRDICENDDPSAQQPCELHSSSVNAVSRDSSYTSLGQPPECDEVAQMEEDDEHDHAHEVSDHHHHHVPTNAFLSIGLQTSIAIALHKLPEGFITYATNHANPQLGFSVFMALFIHNITEGFAMALPLYLAINSRWKAMFWSSLLGGVSQPLGAGIAALWFKLAGNGDSEPGEGVYGAMFAVTAGIMASVALQLFSESLDLTHSRNLCMAFAFVGMSVLGISSALTA